MYRITNLTKEKYPIDKDGINFVLEPEESVEWEDKPRFGYNPRHIKIEEIKKKTEKRKEIKEGGD